VQFNIQNIFKIFLFVWILFIPMKTAIYPISYVLMVLVFLYYLISYKKINDFKKLLIRYKTTIYIFFLIVFSMTISNVLSPITNTLSWRTELNYVFRYFLIFIMLLFLYRENFFTKRFVIVSILVSLGLQGIDGVYQAFTHYDFIKHNFGSLSKGLAAAVFHKNAFGMFMAIGASLSLSLLFYKKKYSLNYVETIIIFILLCLFIFDLLFSSSRASWLFFTTFITFFTLLNYKKIKLSYLFFLIISIAIIAIIFYYIPSLHHRMLQLLHGNSSHRYEIWKNTIFLIKENVFFGHGLMTAKQLHLKPDPSVHNSILEILLFLGIVGLVFYTMLLWNILKICLTNKNSIHTALFFSFLVITQFDDSIIKSIVTLSSLTLFAFFIFSQEKKSLA